MLTCSHAQTTHSQFGITDCNNFTTNRLSVAKYSV